MEAEKQKTFGELIAGEQPVLVDFTATWCGPCKMMSPILDEVKSKLGEKITIIKVDVDKNPQAAGAFQIQGVPTLLLFRNNELKWRQSGVVPAKDLEAIINSYL